MRRSQLKAGQDLSLTNDQIRTIGLLAAGVEERELAMEIRAVGKIAPDERLMRDITARVDARIEKLHRNFVGAEVVKGEPLAEIYSPDLVSTQEELLQAVKKGDERSAAAARQRLSLWSLTAEQVAAIEKSGAASRTVAFLAPAGGVIMTLAAHQGHWVKAGDHYMEVVDLAAVWLYAEVYEYETAYVQLGQRVSISAPAFPGEAFEGTVSYRHPFIDEKARTLRVRVDIDNPKRRLLPGMVVNATIRVPLGPGGTPLGPAGEVEVDEYFCHMDGVFPGPGKCPKCGMTLDVRKVKKPAIEERTVWVCGPCCPDVREPKGGICPKCPMELKPKKEIGVPRALAVPRSAVLDSGLRKFVFVQVKPRTYRRTEVELGPLAGDRYPVKSGLKAGDAVVVAAAYLLDSQTQITVGSSALYSGSTEVKDERK